MAVINCPAATAAAASAYGLLPCSRERWGCRMGRESESRLLQSATSLV